MVDAKLLKVDIIETAEVVEHAETDVNDQEDGIISDDIQTVEDIQENNITEIIEPKPENPTEKESKPNSGLKPGDTIEFDF